MGIEDMKQLKNAQALMKRSLVAGAIVLSVVTLAWSTENSKSTPGFDEQQRREIGETIRQYLLDHPEVIGEAFQKLQAQEQQAEEQRRQEAASAVKPVSSTDHIFGNPNAQVKLIEFSDFECPFCKGFHATMKGLISEYEKDGSVAWIYRHFPIDQLHSKARKEAQASECANELGGNKAFWAYASRLFEVAPSNNRLDLAMLPQIAQEIGLDRAAFEACLGGDARGGKYAAHIESDYQDASASGGDGTPYTLVIGSTGKIFPISGAQPYEAVKAIVEKALKEK
jgi:protein-disulfide isomerase